jgi:hypothetical protein
LNTIQTQQHNISLGQKVLQEQADNYEGRLFFLPEHTYYSASTSVGSGKTLAAIKYMQSADLALKNFLYVAPTINLVNQTTRGLIHAMEQDKRSTRNINLIHSLTISSDQSATQEAINTLNEAVPNTGVIIILTTTTFVSILPRIKQRTEWSLVMDEAFSPLEFVKFKLGKHEKVNTQNKEYFSNLFEVNHNDNKSITPTKGQTSLVREIANNNWNEVGSMYRGMQPLAQAVTNNALRVELTEIKKDRYTFATWVIPKYFNDFRECIFLAALFEETILYHLWSQEYKATFKPHRFFDEVIERNIHTSQGHLVSIGHLLDPNDKASRYNLESNYKTGKPRQKEGLRIIDKCVSTAQSYFTGKSILLQVNKWTGYDRRHKTNKNVTVIPCVSQGLNQYQDHRAIAALAVTNPEPHMLTWLKERTKLPEEILYRAFRIHNVYQACGRTAIRDWNNKERVTFLVVGREDALFLHQLFQGSTWLGQVGNIPSLKLLRMRHKQKNVTISENEEYKTLRNKRDSIKRRIRKDKATENDQLELKKIDKDINNIKVRYTNNRKFSEAVAPKF